MDSSIDHNQTLQQMGFFSAADLEANRQGRFSHSQLKRIEELRSHSRQSAQRYEQRASPIASILLVGIILVALALDYNGNLKVLEDILGNFFLPAMLAVLSLTILFILVIIPIQYQDWVEAYSAKRTLLAVSPMRTLHMLEGQVRTYALESVDEQQERQFQHGSHVLQINSIRLLIPASLSRAIEPERTYRVYAVIDHGAWNLLSMEDIEQTHAEQIRGNHFITGVTL